MKIAQPEPRRRSALLSRDGDRDQLGRRRGVEIGSAKPRGALERAVLVEDDALLDQRRPGQEVGEALRCDGDIRRGSSSIEPHATRCCG